MVNVLLLGYRLDSLIVDDLESSTFLPDIWIRFATSSKANARCILASPVAPLALQTTDNWDNMTKISMGKKLLLSMVQSKYASILFL